MNQYHYEVGDIVKLKKQHPCGSSEWEILRVGADFRLTEEADYTKWYGLPFKHPALHKKALYCLPEIKGVGLHPPSKK